MTGAGGLDGAGGLSVDLRVRRGAFDLDAAFHLAAGETLAVMGPSGAGKSTVLDALAGLLPLVHTIEAPSTIRLGDTVLSGPGIDVGPQRRGVVSLGQDPHVFPHMNVRENVAFGLRARRMNRVDAASQADQMLTRVGLDGAGDRAPAALSGGQRQRVALARALAVRPALLLLDEPVRSLDSDTASSIRAVLAGELGGITTVLVTHDVVDAVTLAKRMLVIEHGRVTQSGPVRDVLASPATGFVAAQSGLNRLVGLVRAGHWRCGDLVLASGPDIPDGPAAAVFAASAVSMSSLVGEAPPRAGEVEARIERLEQLPSGIRVLLRLTAEAEIVADLPLDEVLSRHLAAGQTVRAHVGADAIRLIVG